MTTVEPTPLQQDALARLRDLFAQLDMPNREALAEWAWAQIVAGKTYDSIKLDLEQRPEYQDRFWVIFELRKLGEPVTERQVLDYEKGLRELLFTAGIPAELWDTNRKLQGFMAQQRSLIEIEDTLDRTFRRVANADPLVREEYARFFGTAGDVALATAHLFPTEAPDVLARMAETAVVAGTGRRFGVSVDYTRAERLARLGLTDAQLAAGFGQVAELEPLFAETVDEAGTDLTAADTGTAAAFGLDAEAARALRDRQGRRAAAFGGVGGEGRVQGGTGLREAR